MQHILIVDDDPLDTKHLTVLLQDEDYKVTTTNSPRQALEHLQTDQVDLIVSDVLLPEMSGLELCHRIRERLHTPFMFLSAVNKGKDKVSALGVGGDDYLVKPYDPNELLARVWALLRRSAQVATS